MNMSWEQYQTNYTSVTEQLQRHEKYTKQLENVEQQLMQQQQKIAELAEQLEDYQETYEKLETRSILNFLRNFTGKREELLQQNIEQTAQIEAKHVEALAMQHDLQQDAQTLTTKLAHIDVDSYKQQQQEIRQHMKAWLKVHAPEVSQQIEQLVQEQQLAERLLVEIDEAIEAGVKAEEWLRVAVEKIRDAEAYSSWDLLGGDLLASMMKYSALDESNAAIHEVQIALQRFQNELLDIQEIRNDNLVVSVDGFIQFADFIFDDIFSDWSVHSQIGSAQQQIVATLDNVIGTIHDLRLKIEVVGQKKQQLQEEKEAIFAHTSR